MKQFRGFFRSDFSAFGAPDPLWSQTYHPCFVLVRFLSFQWESRTRVPDLAFNWAKVPPNGINVGLFNISCLFILARWTKTFILDFNVNPKSDVVISPGQLIWKIPWYSHLVPIWTNLMLNLTSLISISDYKERGFCYLATGEQKWFCYINVSQSPTLSCENTRLQRLSSISPCSDVWKGFLWRHPERLHAMSHFPTSVW